MESNYKATRCHNPEDHNPQWKPQQLSLTQCSVERTVEKIERADFV
jgi:hypothetical protein